VKILFILTYYRPHVSGLTIYVERLAKVLAERGHAVTVLTSHYTKDLPYEEQMDGVRVVRVPVALRFNKGVVMPGFFLSAWREIRRHDVVSIHLPQVEAALAAFLTRLAGRKPLITYHCDLQMPPVWYGKIVDRLTFWDNLAAGKMADTIVAYTRDFAEHSPFLSRFLGETDAGTRRRGDPETRRHGDAETRRHEDTERPTYSHTPTHSNTAPHGKVRVILPPVVIPDPTPEGVAALRERIGWHEGQKVIGFAARFAHEKGADYLINAIPHILNAFPDVRILFAGPYGNDVIGETIWDSLQPLIKKYERYLTFLGTLNPAQMADFYAACDVITVASINNTESFGLVQVEAFMCGTPLVATNLPGVRQPVTMTGMGEIVPIADAEGLARGVIRVLRDPEKYIKPRGEIMRTFELARTVDAYEQLFEERRV
jgi:glycosyltransferase involved in cell wall biosynthesis